MSDFRLQGFTLRARCTTPVAIYNFVGTDYLRTLGIPLVRRA